jgi:hypothetical protein
MIQAQSVQNRETSPRVSLAQVIRALVWHLGLLSYIFIIGVGVGSVPQGHALVPKLSYRNRDKLCCGFSCNTIIPTHLASKGALCPKTYQADRTETETLAASSVAEKSPHHGLTRRSFCQSSLVAAIAGTILFSNNNFIQPENAQAAMQNSQKVFEVGKDLTVDQALDRFQQGQQSLQYLLDHYDEVCQGGGDNVRRYLGTVGLSSGLYGISKVLRILKEQGDVDDIVEFSELAEELVAAINQADGSAYMAIFTTSSTSGVPPQRYYDDAKIEIEQAMKTMKGIVKQLHL